MSVKSRNENSHLQRHQSNENCKIKNILMKSVSKKDNEYYSNTHETSNSI